MVKNIRYSLIILTLSICSKTILAQSNVDSIYYELFRSELYGDGDLSKAKRFALKAYNEGKRLNHPKVVSKSARALGMLNSKFANIDSSEFYFRESVSISKTNGFDELLVYASNDLGLFYENRDLYDSALKYYQISLEGATRSNMKEDMAFALNNIGIIFYHLENYSESVKNLKAAIKIKKEQGINSLHISMMNMALALNDLGRFIEALQLLNEVQAKYLQYCDDSRLAELYASFGYSYYRLDSFEKAKSYYLTSLNYARDSKNQKSLAYTLHYLALISFESGDFQQTEEYLLSSLYIADRHNFRRTKRDVYEAFYKLYLAIGDSERAAEYQTKFVAIKDSIFNGRVAGNMQKIQLDAQKRELDAIIQDKESKIQAFQTTTILTAVIAVLLVVVSLLLFFGFRTRGRINKLLDAKVRERTRELVTQNQELNLKTTVQQKINARLEGKVKALTATLNGLKQVIKKDGGIEARQSDSDKREEGIESRS